MILDLTNLPKPYDHKGLLHYVQQLDTAVRASLQTIFDSPQDDTRSWALDGVFIAITFAKERFDYVMEHNTDYLELDVTTDLEEIERVIMSVADFVNQSLQFEQHLASARRDLTVTIQELKRP